MIKLKTFDPTIKYFDLQMVLTDLNIDKNYPLPDGYKLEFWQSDNDINEWIDIHIQTGEFTSREEAKEIFDKYYSEIASQLANRVIFISNSDGKKIATATLSPHEQQTDCGVIDWFAVSKSVQGQKLSKPMLAKVIEVAKNFGLNKIILHTQTNSWLAAKVYLDFAFEPLNTEQTEGWEILQTIINHPKLSQFKTIPQNKIFDDLMLNVQNQLSLLHKNFDFNVWYVNGRNDVYVNEDGKFFEYKFFDNGNKLVKK